MAALVLLLLSAPACYTTNRTTGVLVQREDAASLTKGVTTVDEVISKFGKPTTSTVESNGRQTITYAYIHLETDTSRSKISAAQFVFVNDKLDGMTFSDTSPGPTR